MFTVIFDHRPAYLAEGGLSLSLLTVPVGARDYLSCLLRQIEELDGQSEREVLVVPTFPFEDEYRQRLESLTLSDVRVATPEGMHRILDECEPSDYLLFINPRRWPRGGFDLRTSMGQGEYLAATHLISLGAPDARARERVDRDKNGDVRGVQRHYDGVTWPEVATSRICLSFVPAWSVKGTDFADLAQLRSQLSAKGVLSRDIPLPVGDIDLSHPDGLLALNELMAVGDVARIRNGAFQPVGKGILAGRGCQISPTARIVSPVVLHDNVCIADGATVVGPTVLGGGSRVGSGAIVAQSVLAPGVTVAEHATVHHSVAVGHQNGSQPPPHDTQPIDHTPLRSLVGDGYLRHVREVSPINPPRRTRKAHLLAKRALDIMVSATGLLVLSPVLAFIAIWIKIDSPGPVFFLHKREGKGGREFGCIKFRTMTADAHRKQRELYRQNEVDGPQFKLTHDPRVTRLGQWLRGTNLDELPQLINVLMGDMSLVGPRPSPFRENQVCVPWRRARLSVQPGITGLWQMCRAEDRSEGDFHEWIFYDIAYVRHFSIWMDLKILLATILTGGGRHSVSISWFVPPDSGPQSTDIEQK